jgi:hypothetical protein
MHKDECSNVLCVVDRVNLSYCRNTISLEKGIVELRELEIAVHSTTQMSSQQDDYQVALITPWWVNKRRSKNIL